MLGVVEHLLPHCNHWGHEFVHFVQSMHKTFNLACFWKLKQVSCDVSLSLIWTTIRFLRFMYSILLPRLLVFVTLPFNLFYTPSNVDILPFVPFVEFLPNSVLLRLPAKLLQCYRVRVDVKSVCAKFQYLGKECIWVRKYMLEKESKSMWLCDVTPATFSSTTYCTVGTMGNQKPPQVRLHV